MLTIAYTIILMESHKGPMWNGSGICAPQICANVQTIYTCILCTHKIPCISAIFLLECTGVEQTLNFCMPCICQVTPLDSRLGKGFVCQLLCAFHYNFSPICNATDFFTYS